MSRQFLGLFLFIAGLTSFSLADVIVVKSDGTGDYGTVQDAIFAADPCDEIVLMPGTYTGPGNRDINFLSKPIMVRSSDPDNPAVVAATVIDCQGSTADNHRGFIFDRGESRRSILRGLTIIHGYTANDGGAVLCGMNCGAVIEKNIIQYNTAGNAGGGIQCWDAKPLIHNNKILNNIALAGGGISVTQGTGDIIIEDNVISHNYASPEKGGGVVINNAEVSLIGNEITHNESTNSGGGLACVNGARGYVERNQFIGNSSQGAGGGIYCDHSSPEILNNVFGDNFAHYEGGGIMCNNQSNGLIVNNSVGYNRVNGGGGGIFCRFNSVPEVINNVVAFNQGGISKESSSPPFILSHNCVYGNSVDYGGGLTAGATDISVDPCWVVSGPGYLHLQPNSGCIDRGDDSMVSLGGMDIDGQSRLQGSHVDIGADESDGTWWPQWIHVKADGTGDYPKIQDALDTARDGDTVILEAGTYLGDRNRDLDFKGKAIVVQSSDPGDPCVVAGTVIDCGTFDGSQRGFKFHTQEGPDSVLAGVTIINGEAPADATVNGQTNGHGGGIYMEGASPTIRQCVIQECKANYYGGGICLNTGANATLTDCIIRENGYAWATGVYCYDSYPVFRDCRIEGNRSMMHHIGGIGMGDCMAGTVRLTGCQIEGNFAQNGDSGLSIGHSTVHLDRCAMVGNNGGHGGGGIYCYDGSVVELSMCRITGNRLRNDFQHGAGLRAKDSQVILRNCTVSGNWSRWEAAVAVWFENCSAVTVKNSIVWKNEPLLKQIDMHNSTGSVNYCTINGAVPAGGTGNITDDPLLAREGQWQDPCNTPAERTDDFWVEGDYHLRSRVGRWDPSGGGGAGAWTVDADHSPAIDGGDPADPIGDEPKPSGGVINMGCYGGTEFASKNWIPADFNGDGQVDMLDFAVFARYWLVGVE